MLTRRLSRREVLLAALGSAGLIVTPRWLAATRSGASTDGLGVPDVNGVRLPRGFSSRIVARSGQPPISGSSYRWPGSPDGGACFASAGGGWVYVANSELTAGAGGVGALRFNAAGDVVDAYPILHGTTLNCDGGPTPWGTWLSCEEYPQGRVWECDPSGRAAAVVRPALGVFSHEAVAIDPTAGCLYLTEDAPAGRFYRFTPAASAQGRVDLSAGMLEVAAVAAGSPAKGSPAAMA